jgi:hypothetical protein
VGKFSNLLLEKGKFILLGLEQLFRVSDTGDLVLLLLALKVIELSLIDFDELVDVVELLLHEF